MVKRGASSTSGTSDLPLFANLDRESAFPKADAVQANRLEEEIVPVGKYKGQNIEILSRDRDYCDWLLSQPWVRERFPGFYKIIINNVQIPSETPEHNELQALFLGDDFCRKFLWVAAVFAIRDAYVWERNFNIQQIGKMLSEAKKSKKTQWQKKAMNTGKLNTKK